MIEKRGEGTWRIRVYRGVKDGKDDYITETFHGPKNDARKRETAIKRDLDDTPLAAISARSFQSYAKQWIEAKEQKVMPNTYSAYVEYIDTASKYFGYTKLVDIEKHHIQQYLDLLASGKFGKARRGKLSQTTIKKIFFVLRKMFADALENRSPMLTMETPRSKRPPAKLPKTAEADALYHRLANDPEMLLATTLGVYHGMRRGEIFALDWRDISGAKIYIDKSLKHVRGGGYVVGNPKGDESIRVITIDPDTEALLSTVRNLHGVTRLSGPLFSFSIDAFSSRFRKILNEMGVIFTFHSLRHYHLTSLRKEGYSPAWIAKRAGHSVKVLDEIYTHLLDEDDDAQDKKIRHRAARPKPPETKKAEEQK